METLQKNVNKRIFTNVRDSLNKKRTNQFDPKTNWFAHVRQNIPIYFVAEFSQ